MINEIMDKREEILYKEFDAISEDCRTRKEDIQLAITLNPDVDKIINAMDENGKQMCIDLLEYMAKNRVICGSYSSIDSPFLFEFKGQIISKEQLFQNFL
jgi:hypothetical protein